MTELEKAARMALERIAAWNEHHPMLGVEFGSNGVRDYYRQIAREALATTERTLNDTLRDIDAATCPECGGLGVSDPGEPDSPEGPGRPAVDCKPCKGTGWRNGVHLPASQPATTERKGPLSKDLIREVFLSHGFTVKDGQADLKPYVYDAAYALIALVQPATERKGEPRPVAWIHDWSKSSDQVGQILSWSSESPHPDKVTVIPLYTSPQVPEDVQMDAERYRWLRENGRIGFSGAPHWNVSVSFYSVDSDLQTLDKNIDAARKGE